MEMNKTIQEMMAEKAKARAIAMEPFAHNQILIKEIPTIAKGVFEEEFGITVRIPEAFPLCFMFGWEEVARFPIFKSNNHHDSVGVKSNADMIEAYERWRTENLTETVNKIETDVYKILLDDYGIDLCVTNAIIPMMAATYTAGLAVARRTKQTVNMYNMFQGRTHSTCRYQVSYQV